MLSDLVDFTILFTYKASGDKDVKCKQTRHVSNTSRILSENALCTGGTCERTIHGPVMRQSTPNSNVTKECRRGDVTSSHMDVTATLLCPSAVTSQCDIAATSQGSHDVTKMRSSHKCVTA